MSAATAVHASASVRRVARRARASSRSSFVVRATSDASRVSSDAADAPTRRRLLLGGASLAVSAAFSATAAPSPARAAPDLSHLYEDAEDKYAFSVPADWEMALGDTSPNPQSTRKVVAFYPPGDLDVNVNVVATSVGADYQRMGSFGSADEFAYGVAAGMTRPKPKQGPKQFSYVLDAKNAGDKYTLEYTVERPTEGFYQHLLSAVGVGYNGRVSRLYTITAVCPEEKFAANEETLRAILGTFVVPPPMYP